MAALASFAAVLLSPIHARQNQSNSQPAAPEQRHEPGAIVSEVTRVNMLFTVTDKRGRFVTDLNKADFQVFESKKPQNDYRIHIRNRLAPPACDSDRHKQQHSRSIQVSAGGGDQFHRQRDASRRQGHRGQLRYGSRTGGGSDERHE